MFEHIGQPGGAGFPGPVGATGAPGGPGAMGFPGGSGRTGAPGAPGFPGLSGAPGPRGQPGNAGMNSSVPILSTVTLCVSFKTIVLYELPLMAVFSCKSNKNVICLSQDGVLNII